MSNFVPWQVFTSHRIGTFKPRVPNVGAPNLHLTIQLDLIPSRKPPLHTCRHERRVACMRQHGARTCHTCVYGYVFVCVCACEHACTHKQMSLNISFCITLQVVVHHNLCSLQCKLLS